MSETFDYLRVLTRFPSSLDRFMRQRMTLEQARRDVHARMETRPERFLSMVERCIYGYPPSPYLPLLKRAGCEPGDLCNLVKQKGLENALRVLREEGVYITFEEFKARKPVVRGSDTFQFKPWDFNNPYANRDFYVTTGGSTGAAMNIGINLDHIPTIAGYRLLLESAHDMVGAPIVIWTGILPSGTLRSILRDVCGGNTPVRWFSQIGWHDSRHWLKYDLTTYYILLWMRLKGIRAPFPEYVPTNQPLTVARAVADLLEKHGRCVLHTNVSRGLRVCLAARDAGLNLKGAIFSGTAEPTTPGKVEQMNRVGVTYVPTYGMMEANVVGLACAKPADVSDVHFLKDAFVLYTHPHTLENFDVSVPAFNLTTLLPTTSKIMLNLQMDDYGIVEERQCGCELDSYGYTTHLRQIRSYSKLTGEGITLIGNEVQEIIDRVLPGRFGGSPLDYQLIEEEDEQGFTRLFIIVSPRVELQDEQAVVEVMLNALRASSAMADAARTVMQQSQTLQVKRMEPILTARGKLMPFQMLRRVQGANKEESR